MRTLPIRAVTHSCRPLSNVPRNVFLPATTKRIPPEDSTAERDLLRLFLLEKAAYEVAYEASNRPTWIDVPLRGLAQLATQLIGEKVPS